MLIEGRKAFIISNFSKKEIAYTLPSSIDTNKILINNYKDLIINNQTIKLKPYQALIFEH